MNLQMLIDGMNAKECSDRTKTQMTLGQLIIILQAMPEGADVAGLAEPHSYRGYYTDLAFKPISGTIKASELLKECRSIMGCVFEGSKGGDYVMGALTPVWVANYGCCGDKLIALNPNGIIETAEDTY